MILIGLLVNVEKFNLGLGCMSRDVVDACIQWSAQYSYPIMLIASRNQCDFSSGYAFTTADLVHYVRSHPHYDHNRVAICRDHCGPYFSDLDTGLSLQEALMSCQRTIREDIAHGFDLMHIDVGRVPREHRRRCAAHLFDHARSLDPQLQFEYGSEDNAAEEEWETLDAQLDAVRDYREHVRYITVRTGSLTKQTQVGDFNAAHVAQCAQQLHSLGYALKEHNADYLTRSQVQLRAHAGVDVLNIAPQLASVQSDLVHTLCEGTPEFANFAAHVVGTKYWQRWCTPDVVCDRTKYTTSAHYCYGTQQWRDVARILPHDYADRLRERIWSVLDEYKGGLAC